MTTIHPSPPSLTTNDSAVLQALFDAESSPSAGITIDPTLSPFPTHQISPTAYTSLQSRELEIVRTLQPMPLTTEIILAAIHDFDALIAEAPEYAPAYVNRAQAYRTLLDSTSTHTETETEEEHDPLFHPPNTPTATTLFTDLSKAITLSTPPTPSHPVSPAQARTLSDAHTHRGYILLKAAKLKRTLPEEKVGGPEKLSGVSADECEEMASREFFLGGRFGNKVAQQLAVQTNPYAKVCGQIVKEALREEMAGN